MITVICKPCMLCNAQAQVVITEAEHIAWKAGGYVQDVFASYTPEFREMLISGTHPECWDNMFPEEDED